LVVSKLLGLVFCLMGLWIGVQHPISPALATLLYVGFAVAAFRFATFWLWALPSVLALGSFYPLTGNIVFQEYDLGLCALLAGRLWRTDCKYGLTRWESWIWGLFALVCLIGGIRGWMTLPVALVGDQLSVYTTQLNALQQLKVVGYGIAMVPLFSASFRLGTSESREKRWRGLEGGIVLSAVGVSGVVVLERLVTVGLFDFQQELRVCGPCTSMHIGDQHVDAFWALALPFIFQFRYETRLATIGICLLQVVSIYVIFSTMSRATIAAACVTIFFIAFAKIAFFRRSRTNSQRKELSSKLVVFGAVCVIALLGAGLWLAGDAVPKRFADSLASWQTRVDHWRFILSSTSHSSIDRWFGTGLGSYPLVARRAAGRPEQPISLQASSEGTWARIYSKEMIYLEQLVDSRAPLPWRVSFRTRNSGACTAELFVCHKVLLQSYDCVHPNLTQGALATGDIDHLPNDITASAEQTRRRWCPTTIGFGVGGAAGQWVEVTDIQIDDAEGKSLLQNGQFQGSRNWFFTCDDHLIWRAKNCWLHIAVELGILGMLLFGVLSISVVVQLVNCLRSDRSWPALLLLSSLLGFFQVAWFGTLIDTPWIMLLLISILACASSISVSRAAEISR